MRPILLSLLFTPILRTSYPISAAIATAGARRFSFPPLTYPDCRRNFTCAAPSLQDFRVIMSDLKAEDMDEVERLAEPAVPCEGEMLGKNAGREEALKEAEEAKKEEEPPLPKLSAAEFRAYNSMAEHMNYFHNNFRRSWTILHDACVNNKRPSNISLKQFITTGLEFVSHLSMHHGIEEQHVFPFLARKMPEFETGRNAAELLRQHREIHAGLVVFEEYLKRCRSGETELELKVLKEKMDFWGDVLWKHLDQEVKTLGAENMRKYWTLDEMRRMPM
ncbi:hypothetical protein D0Z07_5179 [Hyphodiscus hymeniophilus]|uniref:Hemerythrin-like domain-containing protein n=1 Tax=Hyphodiscus hymeniophilus TaxID=353542 RepID=A0A9P7AWK9_9HELO|nr:hypothetical protein D0Z07_5179 [Hyphodiscus hymeniophilus]